MANLKQDEQAAIADLNKAKGLLAQYPRLGWAVIGGAAVGLARVAAHFAFGWHI